MSGIRRREFITLLGGAVVLAPLAARAQQGAIRRVGFLSGLAEDDPEVRDRIAAFRDEFKKLGWTLGGNVELDARFAAGDRDRLWAQAVELVQLKPDVLLASANTCARRPAASDTGHSYRIRTGHRSGGRRNRRQPRAARGQHHRLDTA